MEENKMKKNNSSKSFQNRFKFLKTMSHKTRNQIAEDLGVSVSAIDRWTQGKRRPTRKMQTRIADYFNVNVKYLMGNSEESGDEQSDDFLKKFTEEQIDFLGRYKTATEEAKKIVRAIIAC